MDRIKKSFAILSLSSLPGSRVFCIFLIGLGPVFCNIFRSATSERGNLRARKQRKNKYNLCISKRPQRAIFDEIGITFLCPLIIEQRAQKQELARAIFSFAFFSSAPLPAKWWDDLLLQSEVSLFILLFLVALARNRIWGLFSYFSWLKETVDASD